MICSVAGGPVTTRSGKIIEDAPAVHAFEKAAGHNGRYYSSPAREVIHLLIPHRAAPSLFFFQPTRISVTSGVSYLLRFSSMNWAHRRLFLVKTQDSALPGCCIPASLIGVCAASYGAPTTYCGKRWRCICSARVRNAWKDSPLSRSGHCRTLYRKGTLSDVQMEHSTPASAEGAYALPEFWSVEVFPDADAEAGIAPHDK